MLRTVIVSFNIGTTLCTKERVDRRLIQCHYVKNWFRGREQLVLLVQAYTCVDEQLVCRDNVCVHICSGNVNCVVHGAHCTPTKGLTQTINCWKMELIKIIRTKYITVNNQALLLCLIKKKGENFLYLHNNASGYK